MTTPNLLIRRFIGSKHLKMAVLALWGSAVCLMLLSAVQPSSAQSPTRTPLPSLTPSPTLSLPTTAPTSAVPTNTLSPLLQPTATSPLLAETPTAISTPAATPNLLQAGSAPPLTLELPEGWLGAYQVVPVRVALEAYPMNVAVYRGALREGGIGTLIVLWGFPSIAPPPTVPPLAGTPTVPPDPLGDFVSRALYSDGLRLLQGAVIDITCNVGTTGQTALSVAGVAGIGTYYSVTQCQGEPDTAGWFVGARFNNRNFLFYVYVEPVEAYNTARAQLQEILDSVRFSVPTPTAAP